MGARGNVVKELRELEARLVERLKLTDEQRERAYEALTEKQLDLLSFARADMSQEEMAQRLGIHQSNVSRMLNRIVRDLPKWLTISGLQPSKDYKS